MSVQVKHRRDTNAVLAAYVLAEAEFAYNTTTKRIHAGDGATAGGVPMARLDELPSPAAGFANRILNGDMAIDQNREGATVYPVSAVTQNTLDGWKGVGFGAGALSVQRVANSVKTGLTDDFAYSQKVIVTTADTSFAATDVYILQQIILPEDISDLGFGSSLAKTVTLSFWVKSNVTGTYTARLAESGASRSFTFSFTIPSANTWVRITKTIAGDSSGTWTSGAQFVISLGAGSNFHAPSLNTWQSGNYLAFPGGADFMGTVSNSFELTGVQLEVGSAANNYARVSPEASMRRAWRRYQKSYVDGTAVAAVSDAGAHRYAPWAVATTDWLSIQLTEKMRSTPTVTIYSPGTGASGQTRNTGGASDVAASAVNVSAAAFDLNHTCATLGQGYRAHWVADARP